MQVVDYYRTQNIVVYCIQDIVHKNVGFVDYYRTQNIVVYCIQDIVRENVGFVEYYRTQNICPKEEFDAMIQELPWNKKNVEK